MNFLKINDDIAITALDETITYREFNIKITLYAEKLKQCGITNQDRILVIGHPDAMIETIAWSYAATFMGASPANASVNQSAEEIDLKSKSASVKAHVWYDGTIEIVSDKSGKAHPQEAFVYFSSNTTVKKDNLYSTEPAFFSYPSDWTSGFANEDTISLMHAYLGRVPLRQLCCMGWEIAYAPHNVATCLLTGGSFHWVKSERDMPAAQLKWKTNCISTYPISMERMCDVGQFEEPITFVEISGGACTPSLVKKIRSSINPQWIGNSFGTVAGGLLLSQVIDKGDNPNLIEWMKPWTKSELKVRLDATGLLLFSRRGSEWLDDGDIFELSNEQYRFKTRAHDEHLNFKGGKISTWEIEGYANDLLKTIKGCGDHTYVFPMNGLADCDRHGLIFSGSIEAVRVKEHLSSLISWKQPQRIYRVSDQFWKSEIKVSRSRMSDRLQRLPHLIIEQL